MASKPDVDQRIFGPKGRHRSSSRRRRQEQRQILLQGDLILEKVDAIPSDAVPVEVERLPDGGIDLGGGYILYPGEKEKQ